MRIGHSQRLPTWLPSTLTRILPERPSVSGSCTRPSLISLCPESDDATPETDRLAAAGVLVGRCLFRSSKLVTGHSVPLEGHGAEARVVRSREDGHSLADLLGRAAGAVADLASARLPELLTAACRKAMPSTPFTLRCTSRASRGTRSGPDLALLGPSLGSEASVLPWLQWSPGYWRSRGGRFRWRPCVPGATPSPGKWRLLHSFCGGWRPAPRTVAGSSW